MKDENENNLMNNQYWNAMPSSSMAPQLELKLFTSNYYLSDNKVGYGNNNTSTYYWLHPKNSTIILSDDYNYPLLNDKKEFLDHLSMKQLSLCTVRTAGQQVALVFAHYFQDLMNFKMEKDTLVWDDKLTEEEAEDQVADWEEKEWTKRMKSIPERIYKAFFKIQSVTLCMRYYEHVLNHYCCTSIELMDLFTKDSLHYSRRQAASTVITKNTNDYFSKMFYVCLWSNCIGFLSDYTVTQLLLVCRFWYKCYCIRKDESDASDASEPSVAPQDYSEAFSVSEPSVAPQDSPKAGQDTGEPCQEGKSNDQDPTSVEAIADEAMAYAKSLLHEKAIANAKSSLYAESGKLIMIRFIAWIFSSMTAAAGGIIYPKFGTLLFGNLGDSIISSLHD